MAGRITVGARVTTLVELPVVNSVDRPAAPAGSEGVIRRVFDDALGGYQVDLFVDDSMISAVVYNSQISPISSAADKSVPAGPPKPTASQRPDDTSRAVQSESSGKAIPMLLDGHHLPRGARGSFGSAAGGGGSRA